MERENEIVRVDVSAIEERLPRISSIEQDIVVLNDLSELHLPPYPMRLDVGVLALCVEGEFTITVNLREHRVGASQLAFFLPGQILQFGGCSDDCRCQIFAISATFAQTGMMRYRQFVPLLLQLLDDPCIPLHRSEATMLQEYYGLLCEKIADLRNLRRREITLCIFHAMLYEVEHILRGRLNADSKPHSRKEELFSQFMRVVRENYRHERSVTFYADKLCLTPKHLSNVIKEVSGHSAGEWIDSLVVLEAKALLMMPDRSILQVSEELHLANQSFFGKYFKQHVGLSPTAYRRR